LRSWPAALRLLTVCCIRCSRITRATPLRKFAEPIAWKAAAPDTVRDFAATCFFFGRDLQKTNGVPQGLIHSSWGGSIIQAWISSPALRELGGHENALRLLDLHERSPQQAEGEWRDVMEKWWREHDPQVAQWSAAGFDDSDWSTIRPEGFWETSGIVELRDFDGILWLRKSFKLSESQAREDATLSLGPIDDIDSTWINGKRVGSLEGWDTQRDYRIPRGVLKAGVNVIAVGALDAGGGGGMWASSSKRRLRLGSGDIALDGDWRYRIAGTLSQIGAPPHAPWQESIGTTTLYNAMIAPLAGYTLRGVAWYQGESNSSEPAEYARLLPTMMRDWRRDFGTELPFLVVQLAGFGPATSAPSQFSWADIREVQRRAVNADGNAALVSAIDIGDRFDIHPGNKQEVGRRLALAARQRIFREHIAGVGPEPIDARRDGSRIVVRFANVSDALVVVGGNRPLGFELCDVQKQCRFVDAMADRDRIVLDASTATDAAFVRYGWSNSPVCNLYSDELPAVPFEVVIQL
jgi:sialate O-acetylesterase